MFFTKFRFFFSVFAYDVVVALLVFGILCVFPHQTDSETSVVDISSSITRASSSAHTSINIFTLLTLQKKKRKKHKA